MAAAKSRAALAAFLAVLVVGCAGEPTMPPDTDVVASEETWDASAAACARVFTAAFVPREGAQSLLPPGYIAADSAAFFGVTGASPTGRGVVVANAMRCEFSELSRGALSEAAVAVFIESHAFEGEPAGGAHFYELARAAPVGPLAERYTDLGWSIFGREVEVTSADARLALATASVADAQGEVLRIGGEAGAYEDSFSEETHWWHETSRGVGLSEAAFTLTGYLGPGTCSAREGTPFAKALGGVVCPSETLTLSGPPFDLTGKLTFVPHVEGP